VYGWFALVFAIVTVVFILGTPIGRVQIGIRYDKGKQVPVVLPY
jgi:hypothetical protein